jgi:hypothetical protein
MRPSFVDKDCLRINDILIEGEVSHSVISESGVVLVKSYGMFTYSMNELYLLVDKDVNVSCVGYSGSLMLKKLHIISPKDDIITFELVLQSRINNEQPTP